MVAAGSAAGQLHTIQRGDTLSALSRRFGVSVQDLVRANGIENPDLILAGEQLLVPSPAMAGPPAAEGRPPAAPPVQVPAQRAALRPLFVQFSASEGLPADLVMALAWQESGWQSHRVSSTGAVGVMQLMPDTVDFVSRILLRQPRNLDPYDPAENIRMGTRFLRYLLERNGGDVDASLASYYQGLRSVRERGVFDETRRFVANVKALRSRF